VHVHNSRLLAGLVPATCVAITTNNVHGLLFRCFRTSLSTFALEHANTLNDALPYALP
jgi:hypothetical protein